MKKSMIMVLSLSLLAAMLSGCAAGRAMMGATQSPSVTFTPQAATMTPVTTAAPTVEAQTTDDPMMEGANETNDLRNGAMNGAAGNASPSAMTPADAGKLAERIAEAVERISEIDDAEVIVRDERALIAVEFDDQYSAGLDERMKKQITEAAQKTDPNLTEIEITDDSTLYGQVKSLAERIGKATGFDELADDIGDIWDRVTGR